MKKYLITAKINEEIEANNKNEALEKFWETIENEPQQTVTSYLSDHLQINEQ